MKNEIVHLCALSCAFIVAFLLLCGDVGAADNARDRGRPVQLVVRNISPGQDITDHEWGVVRMEVGVEKRRAPDVGKKLKSKRSPLRVKVDGREVSCYVMGSDTGYEGKNAYAYRTLGVRLGTQPGPRTITILYDNLVRTIPVNYRPSGQIEFTEFYDHQAIFGKKPVSIRWLGCYLLRESVKASVNGEPVSPDMAASVDMQEILDGSISPGERLRIGANSVKIEAVDIMGTKREKELVLHYYPDNRVPLGDAFALNLGVEESKSGPFYDAVVEGGSLVKKREFNMPPKPERIGSETVMPQGKAVLGWFEAVDRGESVITTRQKQYSTDVPREVGKARLIVYAGPPRLKTGQHLEAYTAETLFRCALPEAWQKVRDPDRDRKVYGVAAYQTSREDKSAMRAFVEFYASDSQAGSLTADDYVERLLQAERPKEQPAAVAWAVKAFRGVLERVQPGRAPAAPRVVATTVAGRQGKTVERETSVLTRQKLVLFKRLSLAEKFVVVPADAGFYVIGFSGPVTDAEENKDLFEAIIDSFQPLR